MPKKIEQPAEIKDISLLQEMIEKFNDSMPVLLDRDTEIVLTKKNSQTENIQNIDKVVHPEAT